MERKAFYIALFVSAVALLTMQSCGDDSPNTPEEECVTIDDSTRVCGDTQWTVY